MPPSFLMMKELFWLFFVFCTVQMSYSANGLTSPKIVFLGFGARSGERNRGCCGVTKVILF